MMIKDDVIVDVVVDVVDDDVVDVVDDDDVVVVVVVDALIKGSQPLIIFFQLFAFRRLDGC